MDERLFFFEAENDPPVRDDAVEVAQRDNDVAVRTCLYARRQIVVVQRVRPRRKASVRLLRGLVSAHSSAAPPPAWSSESIQTIQRRLRSGAQVAI